MRIFQALLAFPLTGLVLAGYTNPENHLRGAVGEPTVSEHVRFLLNATNETHAGAFNDTRIGFTSSDSGAGVGISNETLPSVVLEAIETTVPFETFDDENDNRVDFDLGHALGFGCFSEFAAANVLHRGSVAMKDLRVGDRVLTARNTYQPIYAFGHYNPERRAEFWQVHTKDTVLEITGEHLVFRKDQAYPVRADSLRVGHSLLGMEGTPQEITMIRMVQRQGLYTPFTPDGTVVVNGIVASTYISLQEGNNFLEFKNGVVVPLSFHQYVHFGTLPLRLFCMGIASGYCPSLDEDGLHPYTAYALSISHWVEGLPWVVQSLVLMAFLLACTPLWAADAIVGPAFTTLYVLLTVSIFLRSRAHRKKKAKKTL